MAHSARNKPKLTGPLVLSVLFHVGLLVALFGTLPKTTYRWHSASTEIKPIVNASVINSQEISKHIKQIRWAQQAKERQARRRLRDIQQRALSVAKKRAAEQKRLHVLKAKQAQERQNQLKAQKIAQARVRRLQHQLSQLKHQALSATQKRLQQQLLNQELKKEQSAIQQQKKNLEKIHSTQLKGVLDKYRAQMLHLIQHNWHPALQSATIACQLLIHLAPGGVVTQVDLLKSSGNSALDRSARLAIIKSSPLPVPKDPLLFENFREVRINMSPQEVEGLS